MMTVGLCGFGMFELASYFVAVFAIFIMCSVELAELFTIKNDRCNNFNKLD